MVAVLPPNVLERETRLLLQRLARSRSGLIRSGEGSSPAWKLGGKGREPVSQELVETLLAQALLRELPDGSIRPTAAGLRRIGLQQQDRHLLGQHASIAGSSIPGAPKVNLAESPVGWLGTKLTRRGKPALDDMQLAAAERIRTDFELAQLGSRVTLDWRKEPTSGTGAPPDLSDRALAARERFRAAIEAIGPELAAVVYEVCCLAAGLEQAERRLALPRRAGKAVLQMALNALARHYGFSRQATNGRRRPSVTSWGINGYRPEIS
jgi:hypothetical protein